MSDAKLRWQCRRGMRELDELLCAYMDRCYAAASEAEKASFRELLQLTDPELLRYLFSEDGAAQQGTIGRVIAQIRSRAGAGKSTS